MDKIKKVHFIGIGGIGMSACAKLMTVLGKEVSGSDVYPSEITAELENMGVKFFHGHYFEQVPEDADLVVYSSAVPEDNPERMRVHELGVEELSYFEFLGRYSRDKFTIAVSGTHGKSTTTAMLGKIMADAGLDPTVIVGSKLKSFEHGNFRFGKSKYFVVEACEYRANFLHLDPTILIITNIEAEHLDFYRDLEDVALAFQRLADKVPEDGALVYNADDYASVNLIEPKCPTSSFGINAEASYRASELVFENGTQHFAVDKDGEPLLAAELPIAGTYNVYNALAAIGAGDELGVAAEDIKKSLAGFKGLWRRMEEVGHYNGAIIVSDYGHHPTEIKAAIQGARDYYPGKRLVWVFQPHHHNRTKELFNDFKKAFDGVDVLFMSDIYDVAGREEDRDQDVDIEELVKAIKNDNPNLKVRYVGDLKNTKRAVEEIAQDNDAIVFQGAGTIDEIARGIID